jgi:hypothetical protein
MRSLSPTGAAMLMATLLTGCGAETAPTAVPGEQAAINAASPGATAAPTIGLSPTSLRFFMYVFRPLQPSDQALKITSTGGGTLVWAATSNRSWLKIGPQTGTAPSTVTVSVDRAALPIGINGYRPSSPRGIHHRFGRGSVQHTARGPGDSGPLVFPVICTSGLRQVPQPKRGPEGPSWAKQGWAAVGDQQKLAGCSPFGHRRGLSYLGTAPHYVLEATRHMLASNASNRGWPRSGTRSASFSIHPRSPNPSCTAFSRQSSASSNSPCTAKKHPAL